ncbi:hypothetical protein AARAC_007094 [Aspergillus arachidicola]|uniref:Transferase family protein n=1 Tax=Aspergillus arachidicola TaxID=656916 RepID=A0A2G7FXY5_9EURO|nr:hypothetical protein AARAC_007094 [Aspergillus arachidicola]
MGSISEFEQVPALTSIERIGSKGYVCCIFPFQLDDNYDIDEVSRMLRAAYAATQRRIPAIAYEAVPDVDTKQTGVLKLQRLEDGSIEDIVIQDCTLGDGTSYFTWMKVWAKECRAQGLSIPEPVELPPAVVRDQERVMRSSGRNPGLLENHPEYTLLPFTPSSATPKMMAQSHSAQVFYFSPESLQELKAEASPVHASVPSDQKWISTNDALSALLWRTVMKVQWPLETLEGDPPSVFNIAIDGRLRTEPPVHSDTLGCVLEYVAVSAPIRKIVGSTNIADLAILIRKAILKADKQFTDDLVALIEKLEDVDRLVPTAFLDVPGFNCVQTSWINFKLYSLDWGSLLGYKIDAVRSPHVGIIHGLQVVLPAPPDGGVEILVGVEESCLDKLLQDPLWMKYAVPR